MIFIPIVIMLLIIATALVLGNVIMRKINRKKNLSYSSELAYSFLFGIGIMAYGFLFLAANGWLKKEIIYVFLVVCIILGWKTLVNFARKCVSFTNRLITWKLDVLFCIIVLAMIIFYAVTAFAPPYKRDSLMYHLPLARSIAEDGAHFPLNQNLFFGNLPALMETLYGTALVLNTEQLAHLMHFVIVLAVLIVIYNVVAQEFNCRAAKISIVAIFTLYELFTNATSAYIDGAMAAYALSGILAFLLWQRHREKNLLILGGAMLGFAAGIKYIALYFIPIVGLMVVIDWVKNKTVPKEILKDIVYLALPFLCAGGFWYAKNLILFDNPFYPFYGPHPGLSDAAVREFEAVTANMMTVSWKNFVLAPYKLFRNESYYYFTVFLSVVLLPFAIYYSRRNAFFKNLLIFEAIYSVVALSFFAWDRRFILSGLIVLVVLGSIAVDQLLTKYPILNSRLFLLGYACIGVIVVMAMFSFKQYYFLRVEKNIVSYILNRKDAKQFYDFYGDIGDMYSMASFVNNQYKNEKILTFTPDNEYFFTNGNVYANMRYDPSAFSEYETLPEMPGILSDEKNMCKFIRQGVYRLYYVNANSSRQEGQKNFESFLESNGRLIFREKNSYLYEIESHC